MQQDSEFYIGWQAEAPVGVARKVRQYILALALFVPLFIGLVVLFQRGFSNAVFEYGKTTEMEGIFTARPVPFLTIQNGTDATDKPIFQKILLVAPGKFGFKAPDPKLEGQTVRASGFLIYHDGKTALEVAKMEYSSPNTTTPNIQISNISISNIQLRGELTDPKCLLGVMQPGQGKPHRDCAARCIAGGIPPVLKVANESGAAEYYLLVGPDGEPLNERLLDYVSDGIQVCGRLEQQADWLVLYADPGSLKRVNKWTLNPGPMCR